MLVQGKKKECLFYDLSKSASYLTCDNPFLNYVYQSHPRSSINLHFDWLLDEHLMDTWSTVGLYLVKCQLTHIPYINWKLVDFRSTVDWLLTVHKYMSVIWGVNGESIKWWLRALVDAYLCMPSLHIIPICDMTSSYQSFSEHLLNLHVIQKSKQSNTTFC